MLNGNPWEYGTFSIYGTEVLLWFIVAFSLAHASLRFFHASARQIRLSLVLVALFLLILPGISIFYSLDRAIAFRAWLTLAEGVGLFYILTKSSVSREKAMYAFLAGMALQAGLGMYQFFTQSTFASTLLGMASHDPAVLGTSVVQTISERWLRAYGTLPHPNMLAGYLVAAITLLLNSKLKTQNILQIIGYYLLLTLFTTALFFTFSRGAWIALFIGLATIFYFSSKALGITTKKNGIAGRAGTVPPQPAESEAEIRADASTPDSRTEFFRGVIPSACVVSTFTLLSIIFWQPFSARLMGQERLEVRSNQDHVMSITSAFPIIRESPLWGVGIGNYTTALHKENPGISAWDLQPPHNIFILILVELGAVGFILFLALLILFFKAIPITNYYLLLTLLVLGLFDHYLWSLYAGVLFFWAICGLAFSTNFKNTAG